MSSIQSFNLQLKTEKRSAANFSWTDTQSIVVFSDGNFDRTKKYVCDRETDMTICTADIGVSAGHVEVRDGACQYELQSLSKDANQRICSQAKFKAFLAGASEIMLKELQKEAILSQFR